MTTLKTIELETRPEPDAAVIWLHGLGASGHDFEPVVPELRLPESAGIRFIFPHAPNLPVTINGGMHMPAWYDIKAMDIDRTVDEEQLLKSADAIGELIEQEIARGIDSKRIIVAGFSQGGAVAYQVGISYEKPLAGILGLSTYFATAGSVKQSDANRTTPIRIYHGTQDPMVPESLGRQCYLKLEEMGYEVSYKTYPMDHSVCLEEILDIGKFISEHLNLGD